MQTMNFQCGRCGNLMAVSTDLLGQQVRCPHCQQVVLAPPPSTPAPAAQATASTGPTPAEPSFQGSRPTGPRYGEQEDIFAPPAPEDPLFGPASGPRLAGPQHAPAGPARESPPAPFPVPPPPPGIDPAMAPTITYPPPDETADVPPRQTTPAAAPTAPQGPGPSTSLLVEAVQEVPPTLGEAPQPPRRPADRGGWVIALILMPLVSYAVLATIAIVFLYIRVQQEPPNPFEQMPDVGGDDPGVYKEALKSARYLYPPNLARAPVPASLHVALGQTLRVGDLEVTPTRVQRQRVAVHVQDFDKPEPCLYESLVLHLHLRNVSDEYRFTPLDNFFDRCWSNRQGLPPLTNLQAGPHVFYGGPAHWYPSGDHKNRREWVQGRKPSDPEGLRPGQETDSFVCTDGQDPRLNLLLNGKNEAGDQVRQPYQGPLLWRVQVRRGPVPWHGKVVSATAVIAVDFSAADIGKANPS